MNKNNKPQKKMTHLNKQKLFYWSILVLPLIQFMVLYIGSALNTILLSFQDYDVLQNKYSIVGFKVYKQFFYDLVNIHYLRIAFKNSAILFGVRIFTYFVSLMSSYYMYKKMPFSGLAKVVFILPSMVGSLIMVIIFKYYAEKLLPGLFEIVLNKNVPGLLGNPDTIFWTLLYFSFMGGLTSGFLINLGTMNGISESLVEAAHIDGAGYFQEFYYITIPMIYKLMVINLSMLIPTFFTFEWNLYEMFGASADYAVYTFGYYMYRTLSLALPSTYPYLSAMGVCMTVISFVLVMSARKCMHKFGPSEN